MKKSNELQELEKILGKNRVEVNKDIFPYLTLRLHVNAQYYFEITKSSDFQNVVYAIQKHNLPFLFLGGGSNVIISHSHFSGLVIRNLYIQKEIVSETNEYVRIRVSSGYPMSKLVTESIEEGVDGFEYHKGLPGTVGGAIAMNSNWNDPMVFVSDNLFCAKLIDKAGNIKTVDRSYFQFSYDYSILKNSNEFLIEADFKCRKTSKTVLIQRSQYAFAHRTKTQPQGKATCGCFFKNISLDEKQKHHLPTSSAGYLIEKAGLKNRKIGSFSVSNTHANFIVNNGSGNPEDLIQLINLIKSTVRKKFGIELEEEVVSK